MQSVVLTSAVLQRKSKISYMLPLLLLSFCIKLYLPWANLFEGNMFKPLNLASFYGTFANSIEPAQTPQNAASDQVLHYLLTECTFKI